MCIRFIISLTFIVCLHFPFSFSQSTPSSIDFGFVQHLMNNGMHDEALFILRQKENNTFVSTSRLDSIHFLTGRALYETKKLEHSSRSLLQVSTQSPFYVESRFFSSYNYFFLDKPDKAFEIIDNLPSFKKPLLNELATFQKAGGALLTHDFKQFEGYAENFSFHYYQLEDEQRILIDFHEEMTSFNEKSMALAAVMSAIVPGTGKMYAGKVGEGLSALLTNAVLGGITLENYLKGGITNPKTILFGSLFTVFYLGNIYGSMVSVKVYREEYYESVEKRILFHLHIPLRTVFKQ